MKIFYIAFKDMKQSFRSFLAIAMMFGVPILMTGMFALLFGGTVDEDTSYEVPLIPVAVVNLDEGILGETIVQVLSSEDLEDLLTVTVLDTDNEARTLVDDRQADAAVIIPSGLTSSLYGAGTQVEVEIYQDPTLTLGPGIVTTLVSQLVDGFSGSTISVAVATQQFAEAGLTLSGEQIMGIIQQYQLAVQNYSGLQEAIQIETPSGESHSNQGVASMLAMVMGGMTVFYTYFTGTNSANSMLTEEANQTLARMLTTATSPVQVIGGKLVAGAMMIVVQVIVLFGFGSFVFDIYWGNLWLLALFTIGVTIGAVTFGLFAISWAKDRKQAGLIVGGGVTFTGMLGMASIFMMNAPNPNRAINTLSLLVPQGWANRALMFIMDGFSTSEVLFSLLGLLVYSAGLFFIGYRRFIRRFA
jgi:ABC-type Na+ efflux pump permease subunit